MSKTVWDKVTPGISPPTKPQSRVSNETTVLFSTDNLARANQRTLQGNQREDLELCSSSGVPGSVFPIAQRERYEPSAGRVCSGIVKLMTGSSSVKSRHLISSRQAGHWMGDHLENPDTNSANPLADRHKQVLALEVSGI
ncbi:Protein of unknown function [Gryllus bimaculatus]|nr:Protein of unknown function [Gryllus bimaculatus]